ncbi:hypothetical protein ScPMuIL_007406 [Solemya velum]
MSRKRPPSTLLKNAEAKMSGQQRPIVWVVVLMVSIVSEVSSSYICSRPWRHVLDQDQSGDAVYGSKAALRRAAMEGAPVRVHIDDFFNTRLILNEDMLAFIFQEDICIESLKHLQRDDWHTFNNESRWQFIQICTTGDLQIFQWEFGENVPSGDVRIHVRASWYVQYNGCKDGEGNMLLTTFANGTKADGDVQTLAKAVSDGAGLTAYDSFTGKRWPMNSVVWTPELVVGYNQWSFSDHMIGNHRELDSWPNWLFSLYTTDGEYQDVHWILRSNSISHFNDTKTLKWFADPCWQLAYSHDENGNPFDGSLDYLKAAVAKGHRVKILMGNFSSEVDDLLVDTDGNITAVLTSDVRHRRTDPTEFPTKLNWLFRLISTNGRNKYHLFDVLNPDTHLAFFDNRGVSWFIDTRPWKHVFSVDENGATTYGSKADLVNAARNGADVRFSWHYANFWSTIQKADTVIVNGTELAAEAIRSLFVTMDSQDGFTLPYHPAWTFSLTSTTGDVDISRWTIGKHESRGHFRLRANVHWFVNV